MTHESAANQNSTTVALSRHSCVSSFNSRNGHYNTRCVMFHQRRRLCADLLICSISTTRASKYYYVILRTHKHTPSVRSAAVRGSYTAVLYCFRICFQARHTAACMFVLYELHIGGALIGRWCVHCVVVTAHAACRLRNKRLLRFETQPAVGLGTILFSLRMASQPLEPSPMTLFPPSLDCLVFSCQK